MTPESVRKRVWRGETLLLHGRRSPITLCPSTLSARLWISWPEKDQGTIMSDWVTVNLLSCSVVDETRRLPALVIWARDHADNFFMNPNSPVVQKQRDWCNNRASIFYRWCTRSFGQEEFIVSSCCTSTDEARSQPSGRLTPKDHHIWKERKTEAGFAAFTSGGFRMHLIIPGRVLLHHVIKI